MRHSRNKVRAAAVLLIFAAILSLCPWASAAAEIIFVAINDNLQPVTDASMPVRRGGEIYVPYTTVSSKTLGVFASYNKADQTLVLFNFDNILYFDIASGRTYDDKNNEYSHSAILHNDTVYVCVSDVVKKMGFYYSVVTNSRGTVIRINKDKPVLTDSVFSTLARTVMEELAAEYNAKQEQPKPEEPGEKPEAKPKHVVITFDGGPSEHTEKILGELAKENVRAAFFLTGEFITAENGGAVRRMAADGHMIGISGFEKDGTSFYKDAETMLFGLSKTNKMLDAAAKMRSRMVRTPGGSRSGLTKETAASLKESGYIIWDWDIDLTAASSARDLVNRLRSGINRAAEGATSIIRLADNKITADAMSSVLSYFKTSGIEIDEIDEWSTPVNFIGVK